MYKQPIKIDYRNARDWVIPQKAVTCLFCLSLILLFVGVVLLIIGTARSGGPLITCGVVLICVGLCLLMICFLLCLHACFVLYRVDGATQTEDDSVYYNNTSPSILKLPDGENRTSTPKTVTMSPSVGPENEPQGRPPTGPSNKFPVSHVSPPKGNRRYENVYETTPMMKQQSRPIVLTGWAKPYQPSPEPLPTTYQPAPEHVANVPEEVVANPRVSEQPLYAQPQKYNVSITTYDTRHVQASPSPLEPYEPQPLVHPSERRPMTFDQIRSSKVSIYDNVQYIDETPEL